MDTKYSFFARISMTEQSLGKWLKSPLPSVGSFSDWTSAPMISSAADGCYHPSEPTVQDYLDSLSDSSELFCYEYDNGRLYIADADGVSSPAEALRRFAAFRGAAAFVDSNESSYLYSFPRESGGDPYGLITIDSTGSKFIPHDSASPDVMYFISDAEDFIEALVEPDDD